MSTIDEFGREVPDPEPIAIRVGRKTIQQFDHIKAYIRRELSAAAEANDMETFEEANDFDIPDDDIRHSPHEYTEEREAREQEAFEDARAKARKEFDDQVEKQRKRPPAGDPEQGGTPAKRKGGSTNRPKQFFLQEVPESNDD